MRTIAFILITLISSCKTKPTAGSKGVFANPKDRYLNNETNALVLYEYGFRDTNLPAAFFVNPRAGEKIAYYKNAFCVYSVEFPAETPINKDVEINLFKSAKPITERAIQRKSFNDETASYWDIFKSTSSLRTANIWIASELTQDQIYDSYGPRNQSDLTKTSGGIRALRSFIEIAIKHEDQNGIACPASHPKADLLKLPEAATPTESGSGD